MSKKTKKTGHFEHGCFVLDKPIRSNGRLSQLNKSMKKRGDAELIAKWRAMDEHGNQDVLRR